MMDELFLYDRDKGLFKEILKQSTVMQGRYHVSPNYGHDLNTNNLEQYIKDPASGLADVKQKYPCCVCIAPKSRIYKLNGQKWEEFVFHLFFLCKANSTGNNQIKRLDADTNTSSHQVWEDWKDMKECAVNFLEIFQQVIKGKTVNGAPLRSILNIDFERAEITRLAKFNNDQVSGIGVSFFSQLYVGTCDLTDYEKFSIDDIIIPDTSIHPLHKH